MEGLGAEGAAPPADGGGSDGAGVLGCGTVTTTTSGGETTTGAQGTGSPACPQRPRPTKGPHPITIGTHGLWLPALPVEEPALPAPPPVVLPLGALPPELPPLGVLPPEPPCPPGPGSVGIFGSGTWALLPPNRPSTIHGKRFAGIAPRGGSWPDDGLGLA